jgi:hypothetical protein
MYVLAEVAGGMPWAIRDPSTGAPVDLVANPAIGFGGGGGNYDTPVVTVPSGGGTGQWELEYNHLPSLSYVPYVLTGDPFYLENHQFAANWVIGSNWYHRYWGYQVNYADPSSPTAANPGGTVPLFPSWRLAARGLGWALRDYGMFYRATPSSVPSWLLPKSYAKSVLDQNQVWGDNNSGSPNGSGANNAYVIANCPALATFGSAPAALDYEEGFYVSFMLMGLGFVVNQAGISNWLPFFQYVAKLPVGLASGTSGWPSSWPSPYSVSIQPSSTDYDGNPSAMLTFPQLWAYHWKNASYGLTSWANVGGPSYSSAFPAWRANTSYTCNSWMIEVQTGIPVLPNVNDVVSLTMSGRFAGSPVTVSHTVNSGDIAYLQTLFATSSSVSTTIIDDLIAKINASAAGAAGISAAVKNTASTGFEFAGTAPGRMFLSFNSGIVGNIVVSGTYTSVGPNTAASLYIQPNGDGVHNGVAGSNLFGRPLQYQAATTGTSGGSGGPTGQGLQTPTVADGTLKWCYVPEQKSSPLLVPSSTLPAPPTLGQLFATLPNGSPQPLYALQAWAGMNCADSAGITGAAEAASNLQATVADWFNNWDMRVRGRFSFAFGS